MAAIMNDNGTGGVKTSDSEPDFTLMKDAIDSRHGIYFILCTVLFFQFVNWIIKSQGPPKSLRDDEWKWRNLYVSWIHAILVATWTILSFVLYPEFLQNLLQYVNHFTYFNTCFATGYFLYDFLDLFVNNKLIKIWEVSLHHIAVVGMFYYNIYLKAHIGFNMVALIVEINSVFLHWRKLYQMVGTPYNSRKYLVIKYINLISFAICRFGPCIAISTAILFWRLKVSQTYYICICIAMLFMDVLNVILFWRLFRSDVLRSSKDGRKGSACANISRDCQDMNGYESVVQEESLLQENGRVRSGGDKKMD